MNENTPPETAAETEQATDEMSLENFTEVGESDQDQPAEEAADATEATIIEKLKAALEESEKRALIAAADLENYRKRSAKKRTGTNQVRRDSNHGRITGSCRQLEPRNRICFPRWFRFRIVGRRQNGFRPNPKYPVVQ